MALGKVSGLAHVNDEIGAVGKGSLEVSGGELGHLDVLHLSVGGNLSAGESLVPSLHAALEGVDVVHVGAKSSQDVGASLSVTLAGVAHQDDLLVNLGGVAQSSLHVGDAGLVVAVLGGVHVGVHSAGDVASLEVGGLAHVEHEVLGVGDVVLQVCGRNVGHLDFLDLHSSGVAARRGRGAGLLAAADHAGRQGHNDETGEQECLLLQVHNLQ